MPKEPKNREETFLHVQHSKEFKLLGVMLEKFEFKKNNIEKFVAHKFNIDVNAVAFKSSQQYDVVSQLRSSLVDSDGRSLFKIYGEIVVGIEVEESFDEALLNNVVAIGFSYFRPLVAQMTVMAKLPPLDLPVVDLSDATIEIRDRDATERSDDGEGS